jgi:hypothetical protein
VIFKGHRQDTKNLDYYSQCHYCNRNKGGGTSKRGGPSKPNANIFPASLGQAETHCPLPRKCNKKSKLVPPPSYSSVQVHQFDLDTSPTRLVSKPLHTANYQGSHQPCKLCQQLMSQSHKLCQRKRELSEYSIINIFHNQ